MPHTRALFLYMNVISLSFSSTCATCVYRHEQGKAKTEQNTACELESCHIICFTKHLQSPSAYYAKSRSTNKKVNVLFSWTCCEQNTSKNVTAPLWILATFVLLYDSLYFYTRANSAPLISLVGQTWLILLSGITLLI